MAREGSFEFFDHAADVGIRMEAPSREDLFRVAATALLAWIGQPPHDGTEVRQRVALDAATLEDLLVRWLHEILYLFQHERMYAVDIPRVEISGARLEAEVVGRLWDESRYEDYSEVKAVTYHQLKIDEQDGMWRARVILDI